MKSKLFYSINFFAKILGSLLLFTIRLVFGIGDLLFYFIDFLESIKNKLKYHTLKLYYKSLLKIKKRATPEFQIGEICYYLDRTKKEMIPVKILDLRWEHLFDFESHVYGEYKTLLGYHIISLKNSKDSALWGNMVTPYELIKIKDDKVLELLKILYGSE